MQGSLGSQISVLRCFRLVRLVRLLRRFPEVNEALLTFKFNGRLQIKGHILHVCHRPCKTLVPPPPPGTFVQSCHARPRGFILAIRSHLADAQAGHEPRWNAAARGDAGGPREHLSRLFLHLGHEPHGWTGNVVTCVCSRKGGGGGGRRKSICLQMRKCKLMHSCLSNVFFARGCVRLVRLFYITSFYYPMSSYWI
jgi:hypothetical protein